MEGKGCGPRVGPTAATVAEDVADAVVVVACGATGGLNRRSAQSSSPHMRTASQLRALKSAGLRGNDPYANTWEIVTSHSPPSAAAAAPSRNGFNGPASSTQEEAKEGPYFCLACVVSAPSRKSMSTNACTLPFGPPLGREPGCNGAVRVECAAAAARGSACTGRTSGAHLWHVARNSMMRESGRARHSRLSFFRI